MSWVVGCYRWKKSTRRTNLGGAFVGHVARPHRQRLCIFNARVLMVYEYSSSGQAIFYKSIARVNGDVSVN